MCMWMNRELVEYRPRVPSKDPITAYKVLKWRDDIKRWESPYQRTRWNGKHALRASDVCIAGQWGDSSTGAGIYSYTTLAQAQDALRRLRQDRWISNADASENLRVVRLHLFGKIGRYDGGGNQGYRSTSAVVVATEE